MNAAWASLLTINFSLLLTAVCVRSEHKQKCLNCCRARHYLLELPYQLMVLNTKADAYQTFKIPEAQLVEVGLIYEV